MTKDMTPMKRFSTNIQQMKGYMSRFFKEVTLNRTEPSTKWFAGESHHNAGVENDFVLIFSAPYKDVSVAFSFNFMGLKAENHTVQASVKKGKHNDNIENSTAMSMDEFKVRINSFNKWANENLVEETNFKTAPAKIVDKFAEIFLDKKMDLQKELEEKQKALDEFIAKKSEELNLAELVKRQIKTQKEFENAKKKIKETIESTDDFKELAELTKKVTELKKKIDTKEKSLEASLNLKGLKKTAEDSDYSLRQAQYTLERHIQTELNKSPKIISQKLKVK